MPIEAHLTNWLTQDKQNEVHIFMGMDANGGITHRQGQHAGTQG